MEHEKVCWLCGENNFLDPLEKHHIFDGPFRKKSEKLGAYVYLCGRKCHREGKKAVHRCRETMIELKQWGQDKLMQEHGWDTKKFIIEMGRNYFE